MRLIRMSPTPHTPVLKAAREAPRPPSPPTAGQLWTVLVRCHKALSSRVEQSVADAGLCLTDFMVLEALLHKGPLTITEIQGKVLLATGSMTVAVDRLENKGLLLRKAVQQDRRVRQLELTPCGRKRIEQIYGEHREELEELMSVLTDTEKRQAYTTLRKLGLHTAANTSHSGRPASPAGHADHPSTE